MRSGLFSCQCPALFLFLCSFTVYLFLFLFFCVSFSVIHLPRAWYSQLFFNDEIGKTFDALFEFFSAHFSLVACRERRRGRVGIQVFKCMCAVESFVESDWVHLLALRHPPEINGLIISNLFRVAMNQRHHESQLPLLVTARWKWKKKKLKSS